MVGFHSGLSSSRLDKVSESGEREKRGIRAFVYTSVLPSVPFHKVAVALQKVADTGTGAPVLIGYTCLQPSVSAALPRSLTPELRHSSVRGRALVG